MRNEMQGSIDGPERIRMAISIKLIAVVVVVGVLLAGIGIYAVYRLTTGGPEGLKDVEGYVGDVSGAPQAYLDAHGFVVMSEQSKEIDTFTQAYKEMNDKHVPVFVTSDSVLHTYHIFFDDTLRKIEEEQLYPAAVNLTKAMLEKSMEQYNASSGDVKEAAKRNVAYFSVTLRLLDPNQKTPAFVEGMVSAEIALVEAHQGDADSNIIKGYKEDFSQYIPRGHYTRSAVLKQYFKAMMYYGRMNFVIDLVPTTQCAVLIADGLRTAKHNGPAMGNWYRIYNITERFVGKSEDLTPMVYQKETDSTWGSFPADYSVLNDSAKMGTFQGKIKAYPPPQIAPFRGQGFRFMGQRFIPDSYMFQELVFNKTLDYTGDRKGDNVPFTYFADGNMPQGYRAMPRGLDMMNILGSQTAGEILEKEGDTDYVNYDDQVTKLKTEFMNKSVDEWSQNMYWSWLYSLKSLTGNFQDTKNPDFMRDAAWQKVKLNTDLASWAELRHDTILYAKQSETMKTTGTGHDIAPPAPTEKGYVEPVPELYSRLIDLTTATKKDLQDNGMLSTARGGELDYFVNVLTRFKDISNKELGGNALSDEDYAYLRGIGKVFEKLTGSAHSDGLQTTIIADVHTDGNSKKVLEEGVGYVNFLVVKVKRTDGTTAYVTGPIFSYYEFKHPQNDRLTDEKWTGMLKNGQAEGEQGWFKECYGT